MCPALFREEVTLKGDSRKEPERMNKPAASANFRGFWQDDVLQFSGWQYVEATARYVWRRWVMSCSCDPTTRCCFCSRNGGRSGAMELKAGRNFTENAFKKYWKLTLCCASKWNAVKWKNVKRGLQETFRWWNLKSELSRVKLLPATILLSDGTSF